jgi:hypothetical protein
VYSGLLKDITDSSASKSSSESPTDDNTPDKEHELCAICNDRATGLHYGIITCEGWVQLLD